MPSNKIQKIAVLTSGGDAPGMNACLRAVVRTGIFYGKEILGIYQGYQGLIEGRSKILSSRDVSNCIQRGGTILKTARSDEFRTAAGRAQGWQHLQENHVDALIAIGGDGTFTGADIFSQEYNTPVICIPGTIDNDIPGTDFTIGFDTANNTAIEAIDKIRDTADSHCRLFFIEVMGRHAGSIALWAGIGGGSEAVLIPEINCTVEDLIGQLEFGARKQKTSSIVIVAEGAFEGGAIRLAELVEEKFSHYDVKVAVLGHLQRGGSPSSFDRVLASRLGHAAVKSLLNGESKKMVGLVGNEIKLTDLSSVIGNKFSLDQSLIDIVHILSI